jgi:hypothetical protein
VACDNVPFHKLKSPYFRALMGYVTCAIVESGSPPIYTTICEWIVRSFNRHKGVVTELLGRSLGRINNSFDAWSSRRFTSIDNTDWTPNMTAVRATIKYAIATGRLDKEVESISASQILSR